MAAWDGYQVTGGVGDQENHGYLKYTNPEAAVRVRDKSNYENDLLSKFKGMDREEEVYMSQGALDRMGHLGTSCSMKRGGDQCRTKEDGKFNFIHTVQVHRALKR